MIIYSKLINQISKLIKTSIKVLGFPPIDDDGEVLMKFLKDVYGYKYATTKDNEQVMVPFKKGLQKFFIPGDHGGNRILIVYWQAFNETNYKKQPIFDQTGRLVPFIERRYRFFNYLKDNYPRKYQKIEESLAEFNGYHDSLFEKNFILIHILEMVQDIQTKIKPIILLDNTPVSNIQDLTQRPSYLFYVRMKKSNVNINLGLIQVHINEINMYTEVSGDCFVDFSFIHNRNYNQNDGMVEEFETRINTQMIDDKIISILNNFSSQVVSEINKAYNLIINN